MSSKPRSPGSLDDFHDLLDALTGRLLKAARGEDPADVVAAGLLVLTLSLAQLPLAERKPVIRMIDLVVEGLKQGNAGPGPDREGPDRERLN